MTEQLGEAVATHLADDGLALVTGCRVAQPGPPWPCHRPPAAPARSTSVVIPTVGRPRYVVELVRSLLDGDVAPDEVIVVDNRPADPATKQALDRDLADEPRVRYLAEPVAGASQARNTGLRAARGDLVAFLDDDVVADRTWLASVHEAWDAVPGVGAVTGLILPTELETHGQQLVQAYGGFDKGCTRRIFDLGEHRLAHPLYPYLVGAYGSGANAVFDRAAITALGGFDTRLGPGTPTKAGEDLDVLLRTVLDGRAIVYEPAALVRHHHRPDDAGAAHDGLRLRHRPERAVRQAPRRRIRTHCWRSAGGCRPVCGCCWPPTRPAT